jgi:hypothetical protein
MSSLASDGSSYKNSHLIARVRGIAGKAHANSRHKTRSDPPNLYFEIRI